MRFKIGDRVKFLNEKGGGVVSKILSPTLVNVEIEDGFELPVMVHELVLDERMAAPATKDEGRTERPQEKRPNVSDYENDYGDRKSPIDKVGFRGTINKGLYLAFIPHDQKWLVTGEMDVVLVNHTELDVLFSFFLEENEGSLMGVDYDILEPKTKILLETIPREELEKWTKGLFQFIFYSDEVESIPYPAHSDFHIKPSRIYKEANYKETPLISEKAFLFNLVDLEVQQKYQLKSPEKKFDEQGKVKTTAKEVKSKEPIDKHRVAEGIAVVDLHIAELLDNIAGLSSHDMLRIQKEYFIKMLENAIKNHYHKVTFIHGVGNGVLKNEIVGIMQEYEGLENQSASLSKFGVGAVDVIIEKP